MEQSSDFYQKCRVCLGDTRLFDVSTILKFEARYVICNQCESVQVEGPHWLADAHSNAISGLDVGLVSRTTVASRLIISFFRLQKIRQVNGIDWGGGTGLLTRMLRDSGLDVYSYDKYANQELANVFVVEETSLKSKMTFVSAIECFEHLTNPIFDLRDASNEKDFLILTTETLPDPAPLPSLKSWWYFMPETGQHVTFASSEGIKRFGSNLGFEFYLRVGDMHFFARKKIKLLTKSVLRLALLRAVTLLIVPEICRRKYSLIAKDKTSINLD